MINSMTVSEACVRMRELVGDKIDLQTKVELIDLFGGVNLSGWEEGRESAIKSYAPDYVKEFYNIPKS